MNPPARFWRRYAAYSLDLGILVLLAAPLIWLRTTPARIAIESNFGRLQQQLWQVLKDSMDRGDDSFTLAQTLMTDEALRAGLTDLAARLTLQSLYVGGVLAAFAAVWFITSEASRWQASPGKRLAGLRVTDVAGARCSPGRIALRFFAGTPSWLLLNLGHAIAAWLPSKRALHDYLAGTRVELAPGADPAMPRWARSWLLLQAALFFGFAGFVALRYAQLLVDAARGGLG